MDTNLYEGKYKINPETPYVRACVCGTGGGDQAGRSE